jgi:hypothetical protein
VVGGPWGDNSFGDVGGCARGTLLLDVWIGETRRYGCAKRYRGSSRDKAF